MGKVRHRSAQRMFHAVQNELGRVAASELVTIECQVTRPQQLGAVGHVLRLGQALGQNIQHRADDGLGVAVGQWAGVAAQQVVLEDVAEDVGPAVGRRDQWNFDGERRVQPCRLGLEKVVRQDGLLVLLVIADDGKRSHLACGGCRGRHGSNGERSTQLTRFGLTRHERPDVGLTGVDQPGNGLGRVHRAATAHGHHHLCAELAAHLGGLVHRRGVGVRLDAFVQQCGYACGVQGRRDRIEIPELLDAAAADDQQGFLAEDRHLLGEGDAVFGAEEQLRGVPERKRLHGERYPVSVRSTVYRVGQGF